jgi:hypothetical protein
MWNSLPDCFLERLGTALGAHEKRYRRPSDVGSARLVCKAWAAAVSSGADSVSVSGPGPSGWGKRLFSRYEDGEAGAEAEAYDQEAAAPSLPRSGCVRHLRWSDAPGGAAFEDAPLAGLTGYTASLCSHHDDNLAAMAGACRRLEKLDIRDGGGSFRNRSLPLVAAITSLKKLTLFETLVTDVSALEPLASLTEIDLSFSNHLKTGVEALGRMTALTTIDLRGTWVKPGDLVHLRNATSLSYSKYGVTVSAQFSDFCLPRLSTLNLLRVDLSGRSHLPSLTSLKLDGCATARDTQESLGWMTSLARLEVRDSLAFEDDGLLLMPLSLADLVVPNFPRLGIQRLTNLVSLDIEKMWTRMSPWPLRRIAESIPPGLRSLTLTDWSAQEWDAAVDAALSLTSLQSLSIVQRHGHYLSADALRKLAAATHLSSVIVNGRPVGPS